MRAIRPTNDNGGRSTGEDAMTLKRLGVTVSGTGDEVVIRPTDGDVERIVNALLSGVEEAA